MKRKVTYKKAFTLLRAFYGDCIELDENSKRTFAKCRLYKINLVDGWKYKQTLICERNSWQEILDIVLPILIDYRTDTPHYLETGYERKLYEYRQSRASS